MAKRLTIKDIQTMNEGDFTRENIDKILPQMVRIFENRARSFSNKKNVNVFSPALEKMYTLYPNRIVYDQNASFQSKQALAFRIQEFFRAKTSSVSGAREVARDQDARLFGVNQYGRPNYRMTKDERTRFWSDYEEFMNQNPRWSQGSYKVQEALSELKRDGQLDRAFGHIAVNRLINNKLKEIEDAARPSSYALQMRQRGSNK